MTKNTGAGLVSMTKNTREVLVSAIRNISAIPTNITRNIGVVTEITIMALAAALGGRRSILKLEMNTLTISFFLT